MKTLLILFVSVVSLLIVISGAIFANSEFRSKNRYDEIHEVEPAYTQFDLSLPLCNWDGRHYESIIVEGYSTDPERPNIAFFPVYPLVCKSLTLIGILPRWAMLLVSNFSFLVGLLVFQKYLDQRSQLSLNSNNSTCEAKDLKSVNDMILMSLILWPISLFFRMGYSESLFFLLVVSAFYIITRKWSPWLLVLLAIPIVACRSVGIAILPIVFAYTFNNLSQKNESNTIFFKLAISTVATAFSCFGMFVFMWFQYASFGSPFRFVEVQDLWANRIIYDRLDYFWRVITFEPVRQGVRSSSLRRPRQAPWRGPSSIPESSRSMPAVRR